MHRLYCRSQKAHSPALTVKVPWWNASLLTHLQQINSNKVPEVRAAYIHQRKHCLSTGCCVCHHTLHRYSSSPSQAAIKLNSNQYLCHLSYAKTCWLILINLWHIHVNAHFKKGPVNVCWLSIISMCFLSQSTLGWSETREGVSQVLRWTSDLLSSNPVTTGTGSHLPSDPTDEANRRYNKRITPRSFCIHSMKLTLQGESAC